MCLWRHCSVPSQTRAPHEYKKESFTDLCTSCLHRHTAVIWCLTLQRLHRHTAVCLWKHEVHMSVKDSFLYSWGVCGGLFVVLVIGYFSFCFLFSYHFFFHLCFVFLLVSQGVFHSFLLLLVSCACVIHLHLHCSNNLLRPQKINECGSNTSHVHMNRGHANHIVD